MKNSYASNLCLYIWSALLYSTKPAHEKAFSNWFFSLHYSSLGTTAICKLTVLACIPLEPTSTRSKWPRPITAVYLILIWSRLSQWGPPCLFSLKNLSGNPRLAVYTIHDKCLKTHVQSLLCLSPIKSYKMHHTLFENKQTSNKKMTHFISKKQLQS